MKYFDTNNGITYQLVPPVMHRRNAAERCIRTFKNNFVDGPSSKDNRFTLHLWDRLLPQATITLNMLRASRRNPKMSAYTTLGGEFDTNKTPLAPPGMKVVIHENPDKRASWAAHGVDGWYLGLALEHYRCYRVYVNNTRSERNVDTVGFFPQHTKVPSIAANDAATTAAQDLVAALYDPKPNTEWKKCRQPTTRCIMQPHTIFQETTARNKQGYATSKPPEKSRMEAANPRVSNAVLPLQTQKPTPAHRYLTRITHAVNILNASNHTN